MLMLVGSLCFLLFGMKMMSDGIQKSAGKKLQSALHFMTGNRFSGLLTGCLFTMLIQSSGATTVMVVSFVNAGLITLGQSVAVIFGANIGTTITAWIVALFGFNFKLSAFAIPIFGLGYVISRIKKLNAEGIGHAVMGFALLFIALGWLSDLFKENAANLSFLPTIQNIKFWSIPIAVLIGIIITALIHSSSAMTAIILTMAQEGLLSWEFSAAMIIGSNIGSTIDSIMACFGANTNAKRTAMVHVLFNTVTALLALFLIKPFTQLVDFMVPGVPESNMVFHIAMLHTVFNLIGTLLFIPFTNQIAKLVTRLIPESKKDIASVYKFEFSIIEAQKSPAIPIIEAQNEISKMADLAVQMFDRLQYGFSDAENFVQEQYIHLIQEEDYLDQMQEQITNYLLHCQEMDIAPDIRDNVNIMINVAAELEDMSDDCMTVGILLKKMIEKNYNYPKEDFDRLLPYLELARQLLQFVYVNINKRLTQEQLQFATDLENMIDSERTALKKVARNRLEDHTNVKAELLYIDLARQIEKMGDKCFRISEYLTNTK